ncbi:MAG: class I SAM-dependent methyltransferase [Acidobacteria bacterium]|nr:class I SAM-dependent methyltransferase [Acidobacteriota bacterium]
MHLKALRQLRCPFCGTRFTVVSNRALLLEAESIVEGVIWCECSAFPVVAGIPVVIADDATRDAMHALEAGHRTRALWMLLGLSDDAARTEAFRRLTDPERAPTYRELLPILSRDAEADCFLYRFSDPTFLTAEALLDAIAHDRPSRGRALDICGGSGHLTRVLMRQPGNEGVVLADLVFWKLWLASRITTPGCVAVCCDANSPLPFDDAQFDTVLLSDAFPYIWQKRMLAREMQRVASPDGVIALPHLHNALGENYTAGDGLTPAAYRDLFLPFKPRLFDDRPMVDSVVDRRIVDLTADVEPGELAETPSVTLVASRTAGVFRRRSVPDQLDVCGTLRINPLYRAEPAGDNRLRLTLRFPTPEYEDEFRLLKRYLPLETTVDANLGGRIGPKTFGDDYARLRRSRVLLDVPQNYC